MQPEGGGKDETYSAEGIEESGRPKKEKGDKCCIGKTEAQLDKGMVSQEARGDGRGLESQYKTKVQGGGRGRRGTAKGSFRNWCAAFKASIKVGKNVVAPAYRRDVTSGGRRKK